MKKKIRGIFGVYVCTAILFLGACGTKETDEQQSRQPVEQSIAGQTEEDGVIVQSVLRDIEYAPIKKELPIFSGSSASVSELKVEPVTGMSDEFVRGVDISSYLAEKDGGVSYRDFEGNELKDYEFFEFLAESGVNWVRIRVWNNPYDSDGNGYGGGNNDIEKAAVMGKLATDAGMKVLIDFHYSDFWADPAKQMAPKEWADKTLKDKEKLIGEYTENALRKLLDEGVNVQMVQIGNEINNGMAGEKTGDKVYTLLKAAGKAVRQVSENISIAVHYTNPEKSDFINFAAKLKSAGVDYDVLGISYYSFWHGTLENLSEIMKRIKSEYGKEVMVMETSYLYTEKDGDGFANSIGEGTQYIEKKYEVSVQGQADAVRDVINTVCQAGGLGVFYWEPAWIPVNVWDSAADKASVYEANRKMWEKFGCGWASSHAGSYDPDDAGKWYGGSSWDNQAMFAFDGTPLESLNIFRYVFGGTK